MEEKINKKDLLAMIDASIKFVKGQLKKEKDQNIRLVMDGEILAYEHMKRCVKEYKEV